MTLSIRRLVLLGVVLTPALVGCSLLSVRTPDKPLPRRELNARMLTREFAGSFAAQVEVAADGIAARTPDRPMQLDALRWKLSASKASQSAATQMAPMMALLDTWALTEQMRQFFATGAGATLFGAEQGVAREVAERLSGDAERLVRGVTSADELALYQAFVERYTQEHPFTDLRFVRPSVVDQWAAETNQQASLVDAVGTVSQSMSDVSERFRMFGQSAPSQAAWEVRLALSDAGLDKAELNRTFAHADESLDRLSRLAESSPELLRATIADVRISLITLSDRFDASWRMMSRSIQEQREALAKNVRDERQAVLTSFGEQRTALAKDAARVADQSITTAGAEVRSLVREILLFGALLYIVLLGLPFAAGYYLGRLRSASRSATR